MADEFVSVGRVTGTYGYQGWVRVQPLTDFPERLQKLTRIHLALSGKWQDVEVESCRPYKNYYLFKFAGINDAETARLWNHGLLQIPESEVYPLPEGYYYHFQLKGLEVFDAEKGYLGRLTEILETGANDVYIIDSARFGEILIPVIAGVIRRVDLENGVMVVALLPGLLPEDYD